MAEAKLRQERGSEMKPLCGYEGCGQEENHAWHIVWEDLRIGRRNHPFQPLPEASLPELQPVMRPGEAVPEAVPDCVRLVGNWLPTEAEIAYGATLQPLAEDCLERNKQRASAVKVGARNFDEWANTHPVFDPEQLKYSKEVAAAYAEHVNKELRADHERLQATVAFMEKTYLEQHGGSWGLCQFQAKLEAAEAERDTLRQALEDAKKAFVAIGAACDCSSTQMETAILFIAKESGKGLNALVAAQAVATKEKP